MSYIINQEHCSACHRCRVECPAQAIRFKNSKYWIDPEKCVDCGHCASVCHNDAISSPEKPFKAESHATVEKQCDVLVIGGGASGLAAAAIAAENGKKVLVLEKNKEIGGSAWYAHVFRSLWSHWHEEAGMTDPRDEVYQEFMRQTEYHVNPKLVRNILDADTDFINWLIDKHELGKDFTFGPQPFGGHGLICNYDWAYNHKRVDTTIGPGGTGWWMANKLLSILLENGGEIIYRAEAYRLIEEDGKVVRVLAKDPGGEYEISCGACVIAAGAYSHNKELTAKFNPDFYDNKPGDEPVHVFTCPTCTGDGILMCDELGAEIDYVNSRAGMFGPMRHPFGTASIAAGANRDGVNVTRDGDRFIENGPPSAVSPLAHTPGRMCWKIIDEAAVERSELASIGRAPDVVGIDMDAIYKNWRQELETELAWETMYRADTLPELAEKLNIPADKLLKAVEEANAETDGKAVGANGPYYAVFLKMFHENAIGGIVVDENMNVLRGGRPIANLYAVGDNTRGEMMPGFVGMMYIESTISALTYALISGYLAGQRVSG